MLDTVQIKRYFSRHLSEGELRNLGAVRPRRRSNFDVWALNTDRGGLTPRLTVSFPPDGLMHVAAEASIPKLLFGYNSLLPCQCEVDEGVWKLCSFVNARTGLDFDVDNSVVSAVHFALDIQLAESEVYGVLGELKQMRLSNAFKTIFEDTTIYFNCAKQSMQVRIYPKLQEVLARKNTSHEAIEAARGKLRFEVCYLQKAKIDRLVKQLDLNNRSPRSLLRSTVSIWVMEALFAKLGFDGAHLQERPGIVRLLEHFPPARAMQLHGFLEMIARYGRGFHRDPAFRFSKDSFRRYSQDCRKAGFSI